MKNNKNRGLISLVLVVAMMFVVVFGVRVASPAASSADTGIKNAALADIKDGTYTGTGNGFAGSGNPIKAEVTISGGKITKVELTGNGETETIGGAAMPKLAEKIVNQQSVDIDAVASATRTSEGVIAAVTEALISAGVDMDAFAKGAASGNQNITKTDKTLDVDIVVVGAGGAGMASAITAKQNGMNVIILEKMPMIGGNTTKATGGMNAAETHYQAEAEIADSVEQFVADTMAGGKNINNLELVTVMARESAAAIDWLDSIGAPLPKVSFSGGATNARIHSPEDGSGVGDYLVNAFSKTLDQLGIEVLLETKATSLITKDGAVVGVKAESESVNYTINAGAVIMATGGFGANEEMYTKYRPDLAGSVTTNAPGATGDGIVMCEEVGADLVDIEQIQLHPTVEQETSMLITEGVRGDGAILVNASGKRFTNEMLTRDAVSAAELAQEGSYAYVVFDQTLRAGLKAIEKYVAAGIVVEAATVEELADKIGVDSAALTETMANWNQAVKDQNDPEFGRATGFGHGLETAPYYAIKIAPGIHHTMGGVKIDTTTQVIDTEGNAIAGLFAAGEVTGGVHGANRIGGNAVADIVVFGRIAGQSATDYVNKNK